MVESVVADIRRIAQEEGVDPDLAVRVAERESRFRQDAVSPRGARGVMQLMPDTARELNVDINDPQQNIRGGVRYLARQLRDFGSPELALAAYNAGPGRTREFIQSGRELPAETISYVTALTGGQPSARPALTAGELESISPRQRSLLQREESIRGEIGRSAAREAELTGRRNELVAGETAGLAGRAAETQREAIASYQAERQMPREFAPTQENAGDLASLFGLLGVIGTLVGGGGKQNAVLAMNAMTGMMQGHRQGRADLYNRERQIYETNMRQLEARNGELRRDMQSALELARTNMDAGLARVREMAARYDSPILLEQARRGDLQGALETVRTMTQLAGQIDQHERTLRVQAEQRLLTQVQQIQAETRRNIAAAGPAVASVLENQSPEQRAQTEAILARTRFTAADSNTVRGAYTAITGTERVAQIIAQNQDAIGVLAAAAARFRGDRVLSASELLFGRARASLDQVASLPPDQRAARQSEILSEANRAIEDYTAQLQRLGRLDGDVVARAAQVQKELFSLALADAVGTGRPTVFLERSLSSLYDQALRPATLLGILKGRQREAVERLPLRDVIGPETMENWQDRFPLYASGSPERFLQRFGTQAPPPTPAPRQQRRGTQAPATTQAPAAGQVVDAANEAEAGALPPGTRFRLPDGRTGTVR